MKVTKLFISILILSAITVNLAYSQSSATKEADDAYNSGEYYGAIDLYKVAYNKAKNDAVKAEIIFKTALCYRHTNDALQAEVWFKKTVKVKYPDPTCTLFLADALKQNEKYDEALIEYRNYLRLVPGDVRGKNGVESCEQAAKWKNNPSRYKVENMAFFNSKESDFSTVFGKKDYTLVYFTSTRTGSAGNETNMVTGQSFADLYQTTKDRKGKWAVPTPIGESINSADEEGASTIDSKYSILYFTRCKVEKKVRHGCLIYFTEKKGIDWDVATQVPVGSDTVTVGHPALSPDDLILYFAAEMPDGVGGKDIWMLKRENKKVEFSGTPINAGKEINTPGDEVFPYVRENGEIYFASNGHVGMGGLDIFKANKGKMGNTVVTNMQFPINSAEDDFGITFEGDAEKGFFTSNRRGGKGLDDIYSFILPPLEYNLIGVVKDEKNGQILTSVSVKLISSDGVTQEVNNEIDGSFKFSLKPGNDYVLTTVKNNYLNGKGKETTKGLENNKDFKMEILMTPIEKPIELENILYDLAKWDLRPESMISLDMLVDILNDNPNIVIEIRSHTDFRNDDASNLELSQKRAQSVVNYLIEKGIDAQRLVAKGYGESVPNTATSKDASRYKFLKANDVLTEEFIKGLATVEEQEAAHQINRRTEFKVLSTDYKASVQPKTNETPNNPQPEIKKEDNQVVPLENEPKPEENKLDESKPEENKTEEIKPEEPKTEEKTDQQ
ncbi:MAG: hypothetical protein A2046_06310 [Bacteroidetes bacterium GWA2_30_7]|nr:MAG: hypothetical protein A2046_06310 [Bacteroidetes bacterium GWA2_30_7]